MTDFLRPAGGTADLTGTPLDPAGPGAGLVDVESVAEVTVAATATPTASKIPIAGAGGQLAPGWLPVLTETAHIADATLTSAHAWPVINTNTGASAPVALTLPAAAPVGSRFRFGVEVAQYLRVNAGASQVIQFDLQASATAGYARSNTIGSTFEAEKLSATRWLVTKHTGVWPVDQ